MSEPQEKLCTRCLNLLSVDLFNRDKNKKDGLQTQCKDCKRSAQKLDYRKKTDVYMDRQREIRAINPHKKQAREAVRLAIKKGKLVRPRKCQECGDSSHRIEAHHHKGYELDHRLDVIFLCTPCHRHHDKKA